MVEATLLENILETWMLITKARYFLHRARQKDLAPYRISPEQAYILYIMHNLDHKVTIAELAKRANRESTTITTNMRRMEKYYLKKFLIYQNTDRGLKMLENSNAQT